MKFCTKCGSQLFDTAVVCPNCGCPQRGGTVTGDSRNAGWAVLGFLVPILGLILYLIWKDDMPLRAKSVGKGALIGFVVSLVLIVLYMILFVTMLNKYSGLALLY